MLSACESGLMRSLDSQYSDDPFGIGLGFLIAGSKGVWSTMWSVGNISAQDLLNQAYFQMAHDTRDSPAKALQKAQIAMHKKNSTQPFRWMAFFHTGF